MLDLSDTFPRGTLRELAVAYAADKPGIMFHLWPFNTSDPHALIDGLARCAPKIADAAAWADPITPRHFYHQYLFNGARAGVVLTPDMGEPHIFTVVVTWPNERGR